MRYVSNTSNPVWLMLEPSWNWKATAQKYAKKRTAFKILSNRNWNGAAPTVWTLRWLIICLPKIRISRLMVNVM